jgi:branched-chain amino acid transport system ATP-binding protein
VTRLVVTEVTVRFGGTAALDGTSLVAEPGAVTGLIGPNGAGKTTMFNVITGLLDPDVGRVELGGRDITGAPPHRRARLGLARTFQRLELFGSLTVRDNVRVGGDIRNGWGLPGLGRRRGVIDVAAETERVIGLCGLGPIADRDVSEVPTGQARVVELARALMTGPSVLLLDEPAAGQTEEETRAFGRLLRRLAGDGLTVCLVEHDMSLVMDVCEVIHVLDYGRTIAVGPAGEIRDDPAVVAAYLGTPEGVG